MNGGILNLPRPGDVRYYTEGGKECIRWDKVEPWLIRVDDAGALTVLAKALDITVLTLGRHRQEMGLDPLPLGRPPEVNITEYEADVMYLLQNGVSKAGVSRLYGVTHQAVLATEARVAKKTALAERHCAFCGGAGVRPCGSDGEPRCFKSPKEPMGPHEHICTHCLGQSTYNANPK